MEFRTRIITRNDDSQKWLVNNPVLSKGEMAIEFDPDYTGKAKLKIGDGVTAWNDLEYFGGDAKPSVQLFEATVEGTETKEEAIARVVGATEITDGAFAIVKALIFNDKYEYTAYIYADGAWKALDGNYNAENVYFDKDLLTTSAIGNIVLSNGQATIPAQGKNLKQLFDTIFVKESNPSITQPSVTVVSPQAKAYEVGTKIVPTFNSTFNPGSYQYGPATGVTVESWEISDTLGNTAATEDGSFPELEVGTATSYKITAKANYTAGAIPVTNVGNEYPAGQIAAGAKSASTATAIAGYRNTFYGTMTTKDAIDSAVVRALPGKSNRALSNGATFDVVIPVGAMRVVIAYPATLEDIASISDVNGLGAEISSSFAKSVVSVEGVNGYEAIDYKVYVLDFAKANDTANKYAVRI